MRSTANSSGAPVEEVLAAAASAAALICMGCGTARCGRRASNPLPKARRLSGVLMVCLSIWGIARNYSGVGPEADLAVFTCFSTGFALFCGRADDLVVGKQLIGEVAIRLRPTGARVIELNRLAVAGGFCEPDVAGHGCFVELVAEEAFEVFRDLLRQVGAL